MALYGSQLFRSAKAAMGRAGAATLAFPRAGAGAAAAALALTAVLPHFMHTSAAASAPVQPGSAAAPAAVSSSSSPAVLAGDIKKGFVAAVGNTPLIRLNKLSAETGCEILAKAEWMNPGGSVKDRAALGLIADAEEKGLLKPGGTVVEGTAGNTGIGLAHLCNAKGYKLIIYMPNTVAQEKVDLLRLLGADVRPVPAVPVTDPNHYTFQARACAESIAGGYYTSQFDNTANRDVHVRTTGPELWKQTEGKLDAFTCATGTGGTLAGTARFLKEASGDRVKIFMADPPGSVMYSWVSSGGTNLERSGSSITEGIGQGRITDNIKDCLPLIDGAVQIEDSKTVAMIYRLLRDEGIFVGASSALNVVAAVEVAKKLGPGHTVATILCDGAGRYQSRLFSKKWLESKGLLEAVPADCRHFISLP